MLTERGADPTGLLSAGPTSRKGLSSSKIQAASTLLLLVLSGTTYCLFRGVRRASREPDENMTETETPSIPFSARAMMAAARFLPEPVMRRVGMLIAKMSSPPQGHDGSEQI